MKQFTAFAKECGGLTECLAQAMFWTDWFWTVRDGHVATTKMSAVEPN